MTKVWRKQAKNDRLRAGWRVDEQVIEPSDNPLTAGQRRGSSNTDLPIGNGRIDQRIEHCAFHTLPGKGMNRALRVGVVGDAERGDLIVDEELELSTTRDDPQVIDGFQAEIDDRSLNPGAEDTLITIDD